MIFIERNQQVLLSTCCENTFNLSYKVTENISFIDEFLINQNVPKFLMKHRQENII